MSGDGFEFEYPDTAGYPDGMGTLHEGTDEAADEGIEAGVEAGDEAAGESNDSGSAAEHDVDEFALDDEEDVDGNV
jgi:hypothetical protein